MTELHGILFLIQRDKCSNNVDVGMEKYANFLVSHRHRVLASTANTVCISSYIHTVVQFFKQFPSQVLSSQHTHNSQAGYTTSE